ncbi:uncharacterized protein LOC124175580 [Neodiprion fabricii]|uniref:uncharacterized protein LOC124175580 n=1 Tax=Neodiprion fabricii TaxID=2872261 RepID=UPI001ED8C412|nr:uncharacterized protein LOC124175580 [Neodiprion fabricii]
MEKEILSIPTPVVFDKLIAHQEIYAHKPYASSTFDNSDEIQITVQHQDLCVSPGKSSLHISGKLLKSDGTAAAITTLVNNAICHFFEDVGYELNAVKIDKCRNVGLTILLKGFALLNAGRSWLTRNAGWLNVKETKKLTDADSNFDVVIPLSMILGFAEDYRKIIVNAKHELILTSSKSDFDAIVQDQEKDFRIVIDQVEWFVPYVKLSDQRKIALFKFIEKDTPVSMSFRSWELYEYPLLPATTKHVWTVKTSTHSEKPRFVMLGFQTNRKNKAGKNASHLDHCNITDVKLFLNSEYYPYGNLNLDMRRNRFALLYEMYANFQATYYGKELEPLLTKSEFLQYEPMIFIDCSKQNDALKSGPVDIHIKFEAKNNSPTVFFTMEFIVDVQGFRRPGPGFTPKELAVVSLNEDTNLSIFLFEPPYDWNYLLALFKCENF